MTLSDHSQAECPVCSDGTCMDCLRELAFVLLDVTRTQPVASWINELSPELFYRLKDACERMKELREWTCMK